MGRSAGSLPGGEAHAAVRCFGGGGEQKASLNELRTLHASE